MTTNWNKALVRVELFSRANFKDCSIFLGQTLYRYQSSHKWVICLFRKFWKFYFFWFRWQQIVLMLKWGLVDFWSRSQRPFNSFDHTLHRNWCLLLFREFFTVLYFWFPWQHIGLKPQVAFMVRGLSLALKRTWLWQGIWIFHAC